MNQKILFVFFGMQHMNLHYIILVQLFWPFFYALKYDQNS